jgi:DNA-directed RNA polymerase subunit K/omega
MGPIEQAKDRDMAGSIHAIRRAAKRARQVAAQTGTALIVWNGQRIDRVIVAEQDAKVKQIT